MASITLPTLIRSLIVFFFFFSFCLNFSLFLPHLEKNVALKQRFIEYYAPYETAYDVLLDDFEPGIKTSQVQVIFDELKQGLVPLIASVNARAGTVSDACNAGAIR